MIKAKVKVKVKGQRSKVRSKVKGTVETINGRSEGLPIKVTRSVG